jgi:hypothetical protein
MIDARFVQKYYLQEQERENQIPPKQRQDRGLSLSDHSSPRYSPGLMMSLCRLPIRNFRQDLGPFGVLLCFLVLASVVLARSGEMSARHLNMVLCCLQMSLP